MGSGRSVWTAVRRRERKQGSASGSRSGEAGDGWKEGQARGCYIGKEKGKRLVACRITYLRPCPGRIAEWAPATRRLAVLRRSTCTRTRWVSRPESHPPHRRCQSFEPVSPSARNLVPHSEGKAYLGAVHGRQGGAQGLDADDGGDLVDQGLDIPSVGALGAQKAQLRKKTGVPGDVHIGGERHGEESEGTDETGGRGWRYELRVVGWMGVQ